MVIMTIIANVIDDDHDDDDGDDDDDDDENDYNGSDDNEEEKGKHDYGFVEILIFTNLHVSFDYSAIALLPSTCKGLIP